jgi:hypothetical protein
MSTEKMHKDMKKITARYFYEKDGELIPLVSLSDACRILCVGRRMMHNYMHSEGFPEILKDGHKTYFELSAFDGWRATR